MTPKDHQLVGELFLQVMHLDCKEQSRLLDERCAGRLHVRRKIESMLAEHKTPGVSLDSPVLGEGLSPAVVAKAIAASAELEPPKRVGDYRILSVVGVGGMGVVYRAEQVSPRREVALKVIGAHAFSLEAVRRFEFEGQLLGRLKHPNIAQVYEAGTAATPTGSQPFLAMELVDGLPLTDYATQQNLSIRHRLRLLANTCRAVQHAHLKGVIHRDLKPANILIDEAGQPKVLDFGVAKLIDADTTADVSKTRAGQLVGTLAYMSPEQLAGNRDAVDVRADVYALGVILYELLAGCLPYDVRGKSVADALRLIDAGQPGSLSKFGRAFRGDLDTLVSTAMAHDPMRRYQSVGEFEEDILRHLRDEPIRARPPSISYQLSKFAKRHKAMFAATTIGLAAVLAAVGGVLWGLVQAGRERDEAQHQARIAEAINDFLNDDLLGLADPYRAPEPETTVNEALDRAAQLLDGRFQGEDRVRAAIAYTLGRTYRSLGEFPAAEKHLSAARSTLERELTADAPAALAAADDLAAVYRATARIEEAKTLATETLARSKRVLGEGHKQTLTCMDTLGQVLFDKGEFDAAAALFEEALGLLPDSSLSDVLAIRLRSSLAGVYKWRGDLDRAEPLDRAQVEICRKNLGDEHPTTAAAINNLATLLMRQTRFAEAKTLLEEAVRSSRVTLGDDHPDTLTFLGNLGTAQMNLKEYASAAEILEEVLDRSRTVIGDDHIETLTTAHALGVTYSYLKRHDDARVIFEALLPQCEAALGEDHPQTLMAMPYLALTYIKLERYADAEGLLERAIARHKATLGEDHPNTLMTINDLAKLYLATDRAAEAAPLYVQLLATDLTGHPNSEIVRAIFQTGQGRTLTALGQFDEAQASLHHAHQTLADPPWATSPYSQDVFQAYVELYTATDNPEEAARWQARLDAAQPSD
jgi:tetratricopeptide (TPR) repeat protein